MQLPGRTPPFLLELDLTAPLPDPPPEAPLVRALNRGQPALREVLAGLRRAADDPGVAGLIVRVGGPPQPLATAQELRDALLSFGRSGRPTLAWAESFGEFGPGTSGYLMATGCAEIWLQPSGDLGLTGLSAEATFLREAFDRAGLRTQVGARHEYKNAPNMATERGFTAPHREALDRLVSSGLEQVVAAVAAARRLDPATVRALVDRAPLTADEALDAGLVDRLGYRDEAYAALRGRLGPTTELRFLHRHGPRPAARVRAAARRDKRCVALVDVAGGIRLGRSGRGVFGVAAGSDTVTAALRAAAADDNVRAVLLRIDSPGGSYVASDAIWRLTRTLRDGGRPVVASMGRVAASGGYYVAMGADRIVAQPGTITGSIGVFSGKVVVTGLLERLGIASDGVAAGAHARQHSARVPFDAEQLARMEDWLDRVYADFTAKVAAGRGLSAADADAVARGRVWTGADAAERGLVDVLGGLAEAAAQARRLGGLPADAPVRPIPAHSPLDRLSRPRSSDDPRAAATLTGVAAGVTASAWAAGWGEWAALASSLGLPGHGPLTAPGHVLLG